jgi:hypothetical protein
VYAAASPKKGTIPCGDPATRVRSGGPTFFQTRAEPDSSIRKCWPQESTDPSDSVCCQNPVSCCCSCRLQPRSPIHALRSAKTSSLTRDCFEAVVRPRWESELSSPRQGSAVRHRVFSRDNSRFRRQGCLRALTHAETYFLVPGTDQCTTTFRGCVPRVSLVRTRKRRPSRSTSYALRKGDMTLVVRN